MSVEIKVLDLQIGVEVAELLTCSKEELKTTLLFLTKRERGRIFIKTQRLVAKNLRLPK